MDEINGFTSQWAILPAAVRYDKELPASAKLLFAEVAAKTNTKGYCWATNDWFAGVLGLSEKRTGELIGELVRRGYLTIDFDNRQKNREKRHIYLTAQAFSLGETIPQSARGADCSLYTREPRGGEDGQPPEKNGPPKNTGAPKNAGASPPKNTGAPKNAGASPPKNTGAIENNNIKINIYNSTRPKWMPEDVFREIAAWCGEDAGLLTAWLGYADMRQRTRHPIATAETVRRACRQIDQYSRGRREYALGMLHKATDKSWRGLFPLEKGDEGYAEAAQPEPKETGGAALWT